MDALQTRSHKHLPLRGQFLVARLFHTGRCKLFAFVCVRVRARVCVCLPWNVWKRCLATIYCTATAAAYCGYGGFIAFYLVTFYWQLVTANYYVTTRHIALGGLVNTMRLHRGSGIGRINGGRSFGSFQYSIAHIVLKSHPSRLPGMEGSKALKIDWHDSVPLATPRVIFNGFACMHDRVCYNVKNGLFSLQLL